VPSTLPPPTTTTRALRPQTLTPLVLELGGKDPFIICDDADVAAAVPIALRGTFQVCRASGW